MVKLHTTLGEITLELDEAKAPVTVRNFLEYVNSGFYDGTIFHRVIDNFMVQGGGFEPGLRQKSAGDPIRNEADNGLQNVAYSVAMARTPDPHSASSQFFINVADNDFLDQRAHTAGLGLLRVRARRRRQGSGGPDQASAHRHPRRARRCAGRGRHYQEGGSDLRIVPSAEY
jgi:peptidyl-prolyl cis-trans isomerase B (cyclophilin B)